MSAILAALYFLNAPATELLNLPTPLAFIAAEANHRYLRWYSRGQAKVTHHNRTLATLNAPARLVADFQDEGFLRIAIEPNVADNGLFYGPEVSQIFVNGRKLNCRIEGPNRRAFYPILNNREPCER